MMFRLLLTVVLAAYSLASIYLEYPPHPAYKTVTGSPEPNRVGIRVRLMAKGLDYINGLAGQLLQNEATKISVPEDFSFSGDLNYGPGKGKFTAWGIKIASINKPDIYSKFSKPNRVIWYTKGGSVMATGRWKANYKILYKANTFLFNHKGQGTFTVKFKDIKLELGCLVSQDSTHRPQINVTSCKAAVGDVDLLDITTNCGENWNCGENVALYARKYNESIEQEIQNKLKNVCKGKLIEGINVAANQELGKHILESIKIPLNKNYSLNYELSGDPVVTPDYIDFLHRGEISWHNEGGTPFSPHPITAQPHDTKRMLHLYYSDFVMNSLLYSAFRHNETRLLLSPQSTPNLASLLRTTCPTNSCIGEAFRSISKIHPDKMISVYLRASQMPNLTLERRPGTGLHVVVDGSIFIEDPVLNNQIHLFDFTTKLLGVINLVLNSQRPARLLGVYDLKDMELQDTNSSIGRVSWTDKNLFVTALKPILEKFINDKLEQGLLIPTLKNVELVNPEFRMLFDDRSLEIATDIRVDLPKLKPGTIHYKHKLDAMMSIIKGES